MTGSPGILSSEHKAPSDPELRSSSLANQDDPRPPPPPRDAVKRGALVLRIGLWDMLYHNLGF